MGIKVFSYVIKATDDQNGQSHSKPAGASPKACSSTTDTAEVCPRNICNSCRLLQQISTKPTRKATTVAHLPQVMLIMELSFRFTVEPPDASHTPTMECDKTQSGAAPYRIDTRVQKDGSDRHRLTPQTDRSSTLRYSVPCGGRWTRTMAHCTWRTESKATKRM